MLPSISQHAKKHGIVPNKKLGQNFLFDLGLCEKIARHSTNIKGKVVIEIGPGPAGLTRAILSQNPKYLIVVEKDERCLNLLEEIKQECQNLIILSGDALKYKITDQLKFLAEQVNGFSLSLGEKVKIISNLPYNITSPLLFHWFEEIELIEDITIMIQKEVAERLVAKLSTKEYGRLSVITQLLCQIDKHFNVSPEAFFPPPKVWSSVISLTPKQDRLASESIKKVELLTHHAFAMRRKMLKSSLKRVIPDTINFLTQLNISPELRAENLSPDLYLEMANHLRNI